MPSIARTSLAALLAVGMTPPGHGADPLMAPGVSRELARSRAAALSNVRYEMTLSLARRDTARGTVTVRFTAARSSDVVLDFRGPSLGGIRVNGAESKTEFNGAHLRIPARSIRAGANVVEMHFASLIAPAGASIIRYHDARDGTDYLYTLLVPSDANALFPCFDQPDMKARMTLSLTVPAGWRAIANGVTERVDTAGSLSTYRFRETDPLPTYLFAFAAGPWTRFSDASHRTPLWVRASRANEVEVDSLQTQVASALSSLERYFGVKYPFQQFQYMLSPAFPFGGMEHPGVTMFNEESFI
jgi:aminopeptidase N